LKLTFYNEAHHLAVRRELSKEVEKNARKQQSEYAPEGYDLYEDRSKKSKIYQDNPADYIVELREYDITYYTRVTIDLGTVC
jgi:hypothetical protein